VTVNLVDLRGIRKTYPGVVALDDVTFALAAGEVRAVLGKNGAGKSTLIKILGGVEQPDAGSIEIDGRPAHLQSPADGIHAGIATVHQELSIAPELSVAENIFLGRWPTRCGSIDWAQTNRRAREALAQLGLDLDPTTPARDIALAERQLVEIARALSQGARILVLDEPTSSLVAHEVEILLAAIRRLSAAGVGVVYISHRMDEIRRVATSVTVMRDGRVVATAPLAEISNAEIVTHMLGGTPHTQTQTQTQRDAAPSANRKAILSVRNLATGPRIRDASFEIRAGEVLGIAGVLGAGRTELLQALVGLRRSNGEMRLNDHPYRPRNLPEAMAAGVFMTPEDRRGQGAVTMLGIDENLVMANWKGVSSAGRIRMSAMAEMVTASIAELGIKLVRPGDALSNLSGGNQQKVVIGKALNAGPRVLLLDEPTRGVDVGAKAQIYRLIRKMAGDGLAVVFVSSEFEEFLEVCDRVLVLKDGAIVEELSGSGIAAGTLLDRTIGQEGSR
jgi:ABC-type sugar transport system ATPase subunit